MVKSKKTVHSRAFFERDVEIGSLSSKLTLKNNGKAIIYARVSSKNQMNGVSIPSQIQFCENYCIDNDYEIVDTVTETISAKMITKQVKLNKIVNENNNIHLVVYDASRLSRNLKDCINYIDLCKSKNITIHFVEKKMISTCYSDMKHIVNDIIDSETEIRNISTRIKRAVRYKKINNTFFPSVPKYGTGYRGEGLSKAVVVNTNEQKIIKLIKLMFFGGKVTEIENLLKEITGNKTHKLYDYSSGVDSFDRVEHGNLNYKDIAEFLNYISIFRREKPWTSGSIKNIIRL